MNSWLIRVTVGGGSGEVEEDVGVDQRHGVGSGLAAGQVYDFVGA